LKRVNWHLADVDAEASHDPPFSTAKEHSGRSHVATGVVHVSAAHGGGNVTDGSGTTVGGRVKAANRHTLPPKHVQRSGTDVLAEQLHFACCWPLASEQVHLAPNSDSPQVRALPLDDSWHVWPSSVALAAPLPVALAAIGQRSGHSGSNVAQIGVSEHVDGPGNLHVGQRQVSTCAAAWHIHLAPTLPMPPVTSAVHTQLLPKASKLHVLSEKVASIEHDVRLNAAIVTWALPATSAQLRGQGSPGRVQLSHVGDGVAFCARPTAAKAVSTIATTA
jgi:hypothetical protein